MSVLLMAKAWEAPVENASRKLVLIKMADNANDEGVCWPSYEYLARHCEMSRRSVIRHVDDLVLTGFIKRTHRFGGVNGNKSNHFKMTIEKGDISNLKALKEQAKLLFLLNLLLLGMILVVAAEEVLLKFSILTY